MTLDVGAWIHTGSLWLNLNGVTNGYQLEASTRAERTQSWRKQEISGPWAEGSFLVNAVRDNITENISVWVRADTHAQLKTRIRTLTDAFARLNYPVFWREGNAGERWYCQVADLAVTEQREYQHATIGLVKATVPRLPSVTIYDGVTDPTGVVPA